MPEIPEIRSRAAEMKNALVGKIISQIEVLQPKSLNVTQEIFINALTGSTIQDVSHRGKWIFMETSQGWLLLNLGMGGEILLVSRATLPEKRRLVFDFDDQTSLSINFWWFGYAHYVPLGRLEEHTMTARLGVNALDISAQELRRLFQGRRERLKSFLLNQERIAGIGNAYIHDILFLARLHPLRTVDRLSTEEVDRLSAAIQQGLLPALEKGGAFYELNLLGQPGGFQKEDILIGYREGEPCPSCGTIIVKIKTGSTSSFICPSCQTLEE